MSCSPRLTAALSYASRGIPVFPLRPGTKKPCFAGNFEAATTDHAQIRQWFETYGDCNIGYEPERIGCALFDIDTKNGVDGRDAWFELQGTDNYITPTIITPTGGLHYLYKGSVPGSHNAMGEGIDTRGRRSLGILPPSVTPDGEYSFLFDLDHPIGPTPANAAAFWANRRSIIHRMETPEGLVLDRPWNIARAEIELRRFVDNGFVAGPGNRDVPCFQVACTMLEFGLSEDVAAHLIHEIWEPACDGLTENEPLLVEKKIASAAKPGGMQNAIGCRALVEPGVLTAMLERLATQAAEIAAAAPPRKRRFTARKPSEGARRPPLKFWDDHRAKGLLPRADGGCAVIVYGPPGSHKSGVLLKELADMALHKGARVLYVAAEGCLGIDTARMPAILKTRGLPIDALDDVWLTVDAAPDLLDPHDMDDFIKDFADFQADFIVMDTGTRCIGMADINSTAIGTAAIKAMEAVGRPSNATVFYVTHPGKDHGRGAIGSQQQENQAFIQYLVEADEQGNITLTVEKSKDGPAHFSVPFQVNLDGVPVVTEVDAQELARRARTQDQIHSELKDAVWRVIFPVLQGGDRVTRTDHGTYGPSYIKIQLADKCGIKVTEPKPVVDMLLTLLGEGRLATDKTGAFILGADAQSPASLQR